MAKSTTAKSHAVASRRVLKARCWHDRRFDFTLARTALLVIDMQRDFFGEPDEDDAMRDVIPKVAALVDAARSAGLAVIHTRESYSPDLSDVNAYRRSLGYVGRKGPRGRFLIRGEAGCDFVDEVAPLEAEVVIDKPGFSAFYQSQLDAVLKRGGIDHLLICGVTTQCCVHSTLRDAVDRGYWCLTVADCCAAEDPALHDAALLLIGGEGDLFGWICDLQDASDALQGRRRRPKASNAKT